MVRLKRDEVGVGASAGRDEGMLYGWSDREGRKDEGCHSGGLDGKS